MSPGLRAGVSPPCPPPAPSGASDAALWPRAGFLKVLNGLRWSAAPAARELAAPWRQAAGEMEGRYLPVGWAVPRAPAKAAGEEQLRDSKDVARHSIFVHIFN